MHPWINSFFVNLSRLYCKLPQKFLWSLGAGLSWFFFKVCRFRRWTILKNLTIAFPQSTHEERFRLAEESTKNMGFQFFEFMQIPGTDRAFVEKHFSVHGVDHYEAAQKKGRGVLLMSLHIGSGDVGVNALSLLGFNISIISKKFKNKIANDLWFGFRERNGVQFIDPHGAKTAFEILGGLKKKKGIVFVIDQFMGKPFGVESTFFGKKTGTAYGLALFSLKTEAPVLPLYTFRDSTGHTHIQFGEEIPRIEAENRDLQIQQMTESYNRKLESIIRAHPEQWMWIHRRWKKWE